jgi:hypothetical protein
MQLMLQRLVCVLSDIVESVVCPHNRAIEYYIEALAYPNCTFWGRKTGFFKSAVRYVKYYYEYKLL